MIEARWPDDIPPPHAELYRLGHRCLDEVNDVAREHPPSTPLEHQLLDLGRSQAIAVGKLARELLCLRHELTAANTDESGQTASAPTALFSIARQLVIRQRNASTSWLQRNLRISYMQASRVMKTLEHQGVVSSADEFGRREVRASDVNPEHRP